MRILAFKFLRYSTLGTGGCPQPADINLQEAQESPKSPRVHDCMFAAIAIENRRREYACQGWASDAGQGP